MLHIICWAANNVASALILGGISLNISLESIFAAAAACCFVMVSFEHVGAAGLRCGGLKERPCGQVDGVPVFEEEGWLFEFLECRKSARSLSTKSRGGRIPSLSIRSLTEGAARLHCCSINVNSLIALGLQPLGNDAQGTPRFIKDMRWFSVKLSELSS